MLKLQPPKSEKYYNNLLNIWIFSSLLSLIFCVVSYKTLENAEGIYVSFASCSMVFFFFFFLIGLFVHTDYDIIREEDNWQVDRLRQSNQDIANYLLEVGKINRKLVRIELRSLLEYSIKCKKIEEEKKIYGKEIKN